MSDWLRAILAALLLAGQAALIAHHHERVSGREARAGVARHDAVHEDAGCRLCALSSEHFGVRAPAPRPVSAREDVFEFAALPVPAFIPVPRLDSSCRAPPSV